MDLVIKSWALRIFLLLPLTNMLICDHTTMADYI